MKYNINKFKSHKFKLRVSDAMSKYTGSCVDQYIHPVSQALYACKYSKPRGLEEHSRTNTSLDNSIMRTK